MKNGLVWQSIIAGYRNNGVKVLLVLIVFCVVLAWLASSFSARSPATLLVDIGMSFQRFVLTVMAVFWVQELYYKDLEKKTAVFLLAYPISRARYLMARFSGVVVLTTIATVISALLLYAVVLVVQADYQQQFPVNLGLAYPLTWAYFWLDILVVVAFTFMLCSFSQTPNLPVICALSFTIAMHAMGAVVDYLTYATVVEEAQKNWILPAVKNLLYILPDLDRLDIRPWTLYGVKPSEALLIWAPVSALAYTTVFLSVSIAGLQRREIV
ncbi:MAG: Cu-processing system permease protein [Chitinophagales bacterium]|jgi:ABC-type transport system involved in multi-copper enzyme maturation permease subunit